MRRHLFGSHRTLAFALLLSGVGLSLPPTVEAQATRADTAAILLQAAQTFQDEGRFEVAEALFHYISERFGETGAGQQAMAALRVFPAEEGGRASQVELMVWATTFGAWMGVAIPAAFGSESAEAYGAGLLLGGPAGFLGGRAFSRSRHPSEGQVRAVTFGSLWGTWMGYGIMDVLDWGENGSACSDFGCDPEERDAEDVFKAFVIGGLAGTVTGAMLARKPIPRGVATASTLGGFWGTWFGLAGGVLLDLEGDQLLTSTLIAGNATLLIAAKMASGRGMSHNRARLISIAGVIGGLAGAGLDLLIQPDDEKVAIGIPLAGSIAGLAVGAGMTADMDRRGASIPSGLEDEGLIPGLDRSLFTVRDGRLGLGMPSPFPTVLPVENARGWSFRPALGVTLLEGRF